MRNPFDTPERAAFRDTVRRFVADEVTPFANQWDEDGDTPWELHQKVGALGVWGLGVSEEWGGLGFDDAFMRAAFAEEFARCGAGGIGAAIGGRSISIGPIEKLANEAIKRRCLSDIVLGRKGSSLAVTEPSGGSDVASIRTTARRDGDSWVIRGEKTFITGGMKSHHFVVAARTGGPGLKGISLFFVDAGAPGFSRAPLDRKMGWWASDTAALRFDDVAVPDANLMGQENAGFLAIMDNFNHERLGMVASMLGMMKECLAVSTDWAQQRVTFGKRLIEHQVIRHKIADMSARIDQIEAYLNQICWLMNTGPAPVAEICKAKFSASAALEFCASEAMQILGGAGYLRGHAVERIYREVKVNAIGGGSAEIMRDLAVRQMGY